MIIKRKVKLFVLIIIFSQIVVNGFDKQEPNNYITQIQNYKSWSIANTKPKKIPSQLAGLCVMPQPEFIEAEKNNPHNDKLIKVYVNEIGKQAMLFKERPKFPVGSIIVKEKLPLDGSNKPELLTVMIKREKGFNPTIGDWEFGVISGDASRILASGKLEKCMYCHQFQSNIDYIFRNYLDEKYINRLR